MAKKTGLSQTAIVRIWHAFRLQPHRVENFSFLKTRSLWRKFATLYMNPPDRAMVLCVDEKSQVQALNRTQSILPLARVCRPGNRTTISGMASRLCSPQWMWRAESPLAVAIDGIGIRSSCDFSMTSMRIFPAASTFTW
jgi:hypothetical protein